MTTDPHQGYLDAIAYVRAYHEEVASLLDELADVLHRSPAAWRRLRPRGQSMHTELAPTWGEPKRWTPDYLVAFFAPAAAFEKGSTYRCRAPKVPRLAFLGALLMPDTDLDSPEIFLGWYEDHGRTGELQTQLDPLYQLLDETGLLEVPEPATKLHAAWPTACAYDPTWQAGTLRMSLRRVPTRLFRTADDAAALGAAFAEALTRR